MTTTSNKFLYLTSSPVRRQISDLLRSAGTHIITTQNALDTIAQLPGISIHHKGPNVDDPRTPGGENCAALVFYDLFREPWYPSPKGKLFPHMRDELWFGTERFLSQHGWQPIDDPQDRDIVVYGSELTQGSTLFGSFHPAGTFRTDHFGYLHRDKVISRWENGHVFEHSIDAVPEQYGNQAFFLRKDGSIK
jgi:hypothetical protein